MTNRLGGIWKPLEINLFLEVLPNAVNVIKKIETAEFEDLWPASSDVNVALIYSTWYGYQDYVKILLDDLLAAVDFCDDKGRSSLHLSCCLGELGIAQILLEHGADPNRWDKEKRATPLHCAASGGHLNCLMVLLDNGALVNVGIAQKSALHYAVEGNFLDCAEELLKRGADPNPPQLFAETPLHSAASLGFPEAIRLLIDNGGSLKTSCGLHKFTPLHMAILKNQLECVKILIDLGADIEDTDSDNQTPLHLACLSEFFNIEIIKTLIKRGVDLDAVNRAGKTALHLAIESRTAALKRVSVLLLAGANPNIVDKRGHSPIYEAALSELGKCAMILIDHGADITLRTRGKLSSLSIISQRTPEMIPKLLAKLDSAIQVDGNKIGDTNCEISLNFKILTPNPERAECTLLLAFIESRLKNLVTHPLSEAFLYLKWIRIRKFFLMEFLLRLCFVILFTFYVFKIYVKSYAEQTYNTPEEYVIIIGYVIIAFNILSVLKEIFQMVHSISAYRWYWENYLQWFLIVTVFLSVIHRGFFEYEEYLIQPWQHHTAGVAIFFVWIELMLCVGKFPLFGIYIQMFTKVAFDFMIFFIGFCCLLLAFGFSFCILMQSYGGFVSIPRSIMKIIVMMSGELNFEDMYIKQDSEFPITSHLIFLTFVVLITIILANLLVGLAVSDIQGLQASAEYNRLIRQTELISRIEYLFFSPLLNKISKKLMQFLQRRSMIYNSKYRLHLKIRPNDYRDKTLPDEIKSKIYQLVTERSSLNSPVGCTKEIIEDSKEYRSKKLRNEVDVKTTDSKDGLKFEDLLSKVVNLDRKMEDINSNLSKKLNNLTQIMEAVYSN